MSKWYIVTELILDWNRLHSCVRYNERRASLLGKNFVILNICYGQTDKHVISNLGILSSKFSLAPYSEPSPLVRLTPWSSPRKDDSRSAGQETPRSLCNLQVHYHLHKSPPLVPVLSQMNARHSFIPLHPFLSKIHRWDDNINIILPSMPRFRKWSLFFHVFWLKFCIYFSSAMSATCCTHFILLDLTSIIIFCEEYNYEAPDYVIISNLPLILRLRPNVFILYGEKPSFTPIQNNR
jgi:hypothetical protein